MKLGIARSNVYRLIDTNMLPAMQRRGRYWIPSSAVEARLASLHALDTSITTAEVAEFFGVHPQTVAEWHRTGQIRAQRISNILCFEAADVVAFVPKSEIGLGRAPAHEPTRTLRGVYYPPLRRDA